MNEQLAIMKQYTTPEQTAKLIELGFEKPKGWNAENISSRFIMAVDVDGDNEFNYSIGELIDILPEFSSIYDLMNLHTMKRCWYVGHISTLNVSAPELIDALYDMVVKLKEEGVI